MEFLDSLKALLPDYAKAIRLNLDATISRSSLPAREAVGAALAAAFAAKSVPIVDAIRSSNALSPADAQAALAAASLMGMNNVWYPFVDMAADPELRVEIGAYTARSRSEIDTRGFAGLRIEAIRSYLTAKGVRPLRLVPKVYGPVRPLTTDTSAAGRASNRRIEIKPLP
jgi:hypothetical protein